MAFHDDQISPEEEEALKRRIDEARVKGTVLDGASGRSLLGTTVLGDVPPGRGAEAKALNEEVEAAHKSTAKSKAGDQTEFVSAPTTDGSVPVVRVSTDLSPVLDIQGQPIKNTNRVQQPRVSPAQGRADAAERTAAAAKAEADAQVAAAKAAEDAAKAAAREAK